MNEKLTKMIQNPERVKAYLSAPQQAKDEALIGNIVACQIARHAWRDLIRTLDGYERGIDACMTIIEELIESGGKATTGHKALLEMILKHTDHGNKMKSHIQDLSNAMEIADEPMDLLSKIANDGNDLMPEDVSEAAHSLSSIFARGEPQ